CRLVPRVSSTPCLFFFRHYSAAHRHLPSFPTRRSSDLFSRRLSRVRQMLGGHVRAGRSGRAGRKPCCHHRGLRGRASARLLLPRSEEHTSELQSLTNLVCRLLLEKKK